jgi:hypothetical protein
LKVWWSGNQAKKMRPQQGHKAGRLALCLISQGRHVAASKAATEGAAAIPAVEEAGSEAGLVSAGGEPNFGPPANISDKRKVSKLSENSFFLNVIFCNCSFQSNGILRLSFDVVLTTMDTFLVFHFYVPCFSQFLLMYFVPTLTGN